MFWKRAKNKHEPKHESHGDQIFVNKLIIVEEKKSHRFSLIYKRCPPKNPYKMSIPTLPKGTILLENQVAGHTFQDSAEAVGMLKSAGEGFIFKPLTKPVCAVHEKKFYEILERAEDPVVKELRQYVPNFHGVHVMNIRGKDVSLPISYF